MDTDTKITVRFGTSEGRRRWNLWHNTSACGFLFPYDVITKSPHGLSSHCREYTVMYSLVQSQKRSRSHLKGIGLTAKYPPTIIWGASVRRASICKLSILSEKKIPDLKDVMCSNICAHEFCDHSPLFRHRVAREQENFPS